MAYCVRCGEKVDDTAVTCPACGAVIPKPESDAQGSGYTYAGNTYHSYYEAPEREGYFPEAEVRSNKLMAVLCYIGILVFIPVIAGDQQSEYLKVHKNQGLILFIADAFLDIIERSLGWGSGIFLWFTGGLLDDVCDVLQLAVLIFWIVGIVYACRGTKREMPGIGKIKIFR